MYKSLVLIVILFFVLTGFSQQKHPIIITPIQTDKTIIVKAKNIDNVQYEVILTVEQKNLKGYTKPITKLVPANSEIEMVTLSYIDGKPWSYNSKYTYKEKLTNEERDLREKKLKDKLLEESGDITKGIVVFSKDGCTRCNFTTKYLLDNNIDFKYLNISENKKYKQLMWSLLRQKYSEAVLKTIIMPVVLVDGELSYNMKDLKGFVSKLKN